MLYVTPSGVMVTEMDDVEPIVPMGSTDNVAGMLCQVERKEHLRGSSQEREAGGVLQGRMSNGVQGDGAGADQGD